jgi:DNA mismatch endonuclease, patch repair protein
MDNVSPEIRTATMRAVRSRNTRPELLLRNAVWEVGLRGYRICSAGVCGSPDLAFTRLKLAVFVDGCYWHRCPEHCRLPSSNIDYWKAKIGRNAERDLSNTQSLREAGWRVLRFWEHEILEDVRAVAMRVRDVHTVRLLQLETRLTSRTPNGA